MAKIAQSSKLKTQNREEIKLPKEIFGQKPNPALIHQVITAYLSNQRVSTASTKTRGQVSGGGKKPWRQKGTGRARHGSIRSPIWAGGGITFGPSPAKNFQKDIPKKMKLAALAQMLSDRKASKKIIIRGTLMLPQPKTKRAIQFLGALGIVGKALMVTAGKNENLLKATRNLQRAAVVAAQDVNALDVISSDYTIIEKPAIEVLAKRFNL